MSKQVNVKIADFEHFTMFLIETRKYRRTINISNHKPFIKTVDMKTYFEKSKACIKVGCEWIEAKRYKELADTGKLGDFVNSPKQDLQNLLNRSIIICFQWL